MECEEVSCTHHYQSAWNNPGEYCKKIGWVRNTMLKTDNHPTAIIIKSNFAYWSQRQPIEKILGRYLQWKSLGRNWYENSKRTKKCDLASILVIEQNQYIKTDNVKSEVDENQTTTKAFFLEKRNEAKL